MDIVYIDTKNFEVRLSQQTDTPENRRILKNYDAIWNAGTRRWRIKFAYLQEFLEDNPTAVLSADATRALERINPQIYEVYQKAFYSHQEPELREEQTNVMEEMIALGDGTYGLRRTWTVRDSGQETDYESIEYVDGDLFVRTTKSDQAEERVYRGPSPQVQKVVKEYMDTYPNAVVVSDKKFREEDVTVREVILERKSTTR